MQGPCDAVLFDLFDTLCHLDQETYLEGKRRSALALDLDPEQYFEAWLSLQDRCQLGQLSGVGERIRESCALLGREVSGETLGKIQRIEDETLLRSASLHHDVLPTLRDMRAIPGLKLAMVSNASSPARALTSRLGLRPFFDELLFSFEIGSMKPEPSIYRAACRLLGVPPAACLFVGDGNGRELEGAMAVGMTALRIERHGVMEPYRKNPSVRWDHSVRDLTEITHLVRHRHSSAGPSIS